MHLRPISRFVVLMTILVLMGCTSNPINDSDITSNLTIRGHVQLQDGADPNDVFVWLEVCDVGTRTDQDGFFALDYPAPGAQPGGSLNGIFTVYFYMSNYRLSSMDIPFIDGGLNLSDDIFGDDGVLKENVVLQKILDINTDIMSPVTYPGVSDSIIINVTMRALDEPVKVRSAFGHRWRPWDKNSPYFMAGVARKINSTDEFALPFLTTGPFTDGSRSVEFEITEETTELNQMLFWPSVGDLSAGEYEIVPYVVIEQDSIPDGLIACLGDSVTTHSEAFAKMPIKVNNNVLIVKDPNEPLM